MKPAAPTRIRDVNRKMRSILSHAQEALAGRREMSVDELRNISQPLAEMAPIVSEAALRETGAGLPAELREYAQNLAELQGALEQVRFMLLTRQAQLEASRAHIETVDRWAAAFQQTQ